MLAPFQPAGAGIGSNHANAPLALRASVVVSVLAALALFVA
jgi:hypothetical protein